MPLQPPYSGVNVEPAYQLRYTWCSWPSTGALPSLSTGGWESLIALWETDGLRVLETSQTTDRLLVTFSVRPDVSPVFLATRAKGRLQHAYRTIEGTICKFSRKLAVRSVGENCTEDVRRYIRQQVGNEPLLDARLRELLPRFTIEGKTDLAAPTETLSGRYWYNLHVVLVGLGRYRIVDQPGLTILRDQSFRIAEKKGYAIASLAVMPDHLHVALRGNIEHSPHEVALAFQNNLSYALGRGRIWQDTYYVGTFGEYNIGAIRRQQRSS
jgi:REP element-mobilizing transposase RayT